MCPEMPLETTRVVPLGGERARVNSKSRLCSPPPQPPLKMLKVRKSQSQEKDKHSDQETPLSGTESKEDPHPWRRLTTDKGPTKSKSSGQAARDTVPESLQAPTWWAGSRHPKSHQEREETKKNNNNNNDCFFLKTLPDYQAYFLPSWCLWFSPHSSWVRRG